MTPNNPFQTLLEKIQSALAHKHTFVGLYVNKKGHIKFIKDANGKLTLYATAALLHEEFMKKLVKDPDEFKGCTFFALSGYNYINNKLIVNLYESTKTKVTENMLTPLNVMELNFHRKAGMAMFMPLQFNLDRLYSNMQKDPSKLFEAAARAKDLIFNESKPCASCGTLCHVPDIADRDDITHNQIKEIIDITSDNKYFCLDCGRKFITSSSEYRLTGCTDFNKIKTVNSLISQLNGLSFTDPAIDFDKAQNLMKDLVSHLSKTKMHMTSLNGDKITSQFTDEKSEPTQSLTQPSQTSPWLN